MQTVISKLNKKYLVTIPELIRKSLSLEAGNTVAFDLEGGRISLRKAQAVDLVFVQSLQGALTEWGSSFDEEAYGDL
jgi:antitoxin PrlF